jgi:hypothetical protein
MTKSKKQAYAVARKLGIRIIETECLPHPASGRWNSGKTIRIHPLRSTAYTVLHEIGHVLCGHACCREHCEYMAHGAAIALARLHKIRLRKEWLSDIDVYAGRSARKACGAIEAHRLRKKKKA